MVTSKAVGRELLGVILVEGRVIDLRDEIQQEDTRSSSGSAFRAQPAPGFTAWRPRRGSSYDDHGFLAPPWCIKPLE